MPFSFSLPRFDSVVLQRRFKRKYVFELHSRLLDKGSSPLSIDQGFVREPEGLLCYGMSSASAKAGWTDGDIQQSEFLVTSIVINRTVRYLISLINPDESWLVFDDKLERDDSNTDPRSCPRRQQQFISWIARNLTSIDRILI
jgi:hypothetical protein